MKTPRKSKANKSRTAPRHYSGALSTKFWNRVGALPEREQRIAYALGCMLQDIEHRLLWFIAEAETPAEKPARKARAAK